MRGWTMVVALLGCGRIDFDPRVTTQVDARVDAPSTGCIKHIAAGNRASFVLREDGTLSESGGNFSGTLGLGMIPDQSTPIESTLTSIEQVSAGSAHACVLRGGVVTCWGAGTFGQMGNGTLTDSFTPIDVLGLPPMIAVENGNDHVCAWNDTEVWCWGDNSYGQVGTTPNSRFPARVLDAVVEVTGGGEHSCVRKASGEVWCWGRNDFGQLGDGTTMPRTAPVRVMIGPVIDIDAGMQSTCARDAADHVFCWGSDQFGQLGDGVIAQGNPNPQQISGLVAASISCGEQHCCASRHDGTVACWGANDDNQLGVPTVAMSAVPIDVGPLPFTVEVSASDEESPQYRDYTCARTVDGVWCWGNNADGALAIGGAPNAVVPTRTLYGCL